MREDEIHPDEYPSEHASEERPAEASGVQPLSEADITAINVRKKRRRSALRVAEMRDANIRLLTLLWCLWLLGTWLAVAFLGGGREGVRWMVFGAATGLLGVWPAYRLSSIGSRWLVRRKQQAMMGEVFMEWIALVIVLQAVIWPLQITGQWFVKQTLLVDGLLVSWSLVVAVIVAWGSISIQNGRRTVAMVFCLVVLLGGVLAEWLFGLRILGITMNGQSLTINAVSPIEALWLVSGSTDDLAIFEQSSWWLLILGIAVVGLLAWLCLLLHVKSYSEKSQKSDSPE